VGRCWVRKNGRLVKVKEEEVGRDVVIISEDISESINRLIVQKEVEKKAKFRDKVFQESQLVLLANELKMMLLRSLSISDVAAMAGTCKALREFITQNFVPSVILPLSEENQGRLAGRAVLSLISTVRVGLWGLGGYLQMVARMNLKQMKRLKFAGPNFWTEKCLFVVLPKQYLEALGHYVSFGANLESIDFLIDNSERMFELARAIASLPRLEEVTLRNSGTTDESATKPTGITMNMFLAQILANNNIRRLNLKGFSVSWDGVRTGRLDIASYSLETIQVEFSKAFMLGQVEAANLRVVEVDGGPWDLCFYHADQRSENWSDELGRRAPALARGCPRLERYNDLDLRQLREEGQGDWLSQLGKYKGRGCHVGESESWYGCHACATV